VNEKVATMKQENQQMFTLDLSKIEGDGDFPCPRCGVTISPEDETEKTYTIIDTKVNGEDLQELTIQCNKCGSKIRLIGFVS
jgi:DNA-directed RNA polymerase subunit RPC12/RpoP